MIKIQSVDYKSIFFITTTLSTYTKSGIPLIKSLELIKVSIYNSEYKNSLDKIIQNLKNGEILSEAMKKEGNLYPNLLIDMLKIGEESGRLDEVLLKVATHFSRRNDMANNIKKIMIYPIFLIISIVIVSMFYLLYILPSFEQLYKDLEVNSSVIISKIINYIDFINYNDNA
ncbi:type II secretion system F family protein, partial [Clostridium tarantellae]|uniref:type II secretion system F family protein n=1 Tax=Clostridium tarantellae TaxID=39493 RepID=UPI001A9B2274